MRKIRTREHLSVFEAQTFEFASLMLLSMDSEQVHGDRWWRIPEFPGQYSTPRRDRRPVATPMMNRGSLNECCHKLFDHSNRFPRAKCIFSDCCWDSKGISKLPQIQLILPYKISRIRGSSDIPLLFLICCI